MAKKTDTRKRILDAGASIIYQKGYNNTGIQEILTAAKVPKGSFYFYFSSKDEFGAQLVHHIAGSFSDAVTDTLNNRNLEPLKRLEGFFDFFIQLFQENNFSGGCPLGNLGQEISDLNVEMRENIMESIGKLENNILKVVTEISKEGKIKRDFSEQEITRFIVDYWQGAILKMKVSKSVEPLQLFKKVVFDHFI